MSKLRVAAFSVALDGYGAGPEQSLDDPLGKGGKALHEWAFGTKTFRTMFGQDGGSTGIDDGFAVRSFENVGAWILGRNMFGPVRGPWLDESWKGWWGDTPPYRCDVFVLPSAAPAGASARRDGYSLIWGSLDGQRAAIVSDLDAGELARFESVLTASK